MPLPIALGVLTIAATAGPGVVKGAFAAAKNAEAEDIQEDAKQIVQTAEQHLEYMRKVTRQNIKKLGETKIKITAREIKNFVEIFSKIKNVDLSDCQNLSEWKNLDFSDKELQEMQILSNEAHDLVSGGLSGLGAGTIVGIGAYHGVTALASAGTGTAISTLSGAASAKATLAWLGGGTIAAGGFGVAGGVVVLGGLVAGPMLLATGGIMESKANKNLDLAKMNLAQAKKFFAEVKTAVTAMEVICNAAAFFNNNLVQMDRQMANYIGKMSKIIQITNNWEQMDNQQKKDIAVCVTFVQTAKKFMDIPLLGEDGLISRQAKDLCDRNDNKITREDLKEWENKNVNRKNEIMIIADPLQNREIAEQIMLDLDKMKKFFVLAVLERNTKKALRYGLIERSRIDMEELLQTKKQPFTS